MSETAAPPAESRPHAHSDGHAPSPSALPMDFEKSELTRFDKDDVQAGGSIGKMLALIFLYTILAMGIAGWWTYRAILH